MTCDEVKTLIEQGIPGADVEVGDLTGTSDHFDVRIASDQFEGKSIIDQHKMVHAAVADFMGDGKPIHALQIKTSKA